MKLFAFDLKHDSIHGELELGELNEVEVQRIKTIIEWLKSINYIDSYYKEIQIGSAIKFKPFIDEDGEVDGSYLEVE